MAHAIIELQTKLILALKNDAQLVSHLGSDAIFDAPPERKQAPFVAIIRHDIISKDGDETPTNEHRILLHARHNHVSRKSVLEIVDRVLDVALNQDISSANLHVTYVNHIKTETMIDNKSSTALATISLRILSEPI
ncbi:MAG: DUF3168 domain-containing protein [Devosiaceae bacterium]|nr:DUF3168 domain-containing protein [Devosiaceae bacterium]